MFVLIVIRVVNILVSVKFNVWNFLLVFIYVFFSMYWNILVYVLKIVCWIYFYVNDKNKYVYICYLMFFEIKYVYF